MASKKRKFKWTCPTCFTDYEFTVNRKIKAVMDDSPTVDYLEGDYDMTPAIITPQNWTVN